MNRSEFLEAIIHHNTFNIKDDTIKQVDSEKNNLPNPLLPLIDKL